MEQINEKVRQVLTIMHDYDFESDFFTDEIQELVDSVIEATLFVVIPGSK